MGRFLKPRMVTRQAGRLVPDIDDPAPDPQMGMLITNGREVVALPTSTSVPSEDK